MQPGPQTEQLNGKTTLHKTKPISIACTAGGETPEKPSAGLQQGLPQAPAEQGWWEHSEARASPAFLHGAAAVVPSEPLTQRLRGKPRVRG